MLIGYKSVSKNDGSQNMDLQKDAMIQPGFYSEIIYQDLNIGAHDNRLGLTNCMKALQLGKMRLCFGLFAVLAEYERELIFERTKTGLDSDWAKGRHSGRPRKMDKVTLRITLAAMVDRN